ncbi:double-stranded RNA-binding protein 4-like isoform X2 [Diospyros lotus]|nr:double-stranded RNA-binding protein 4-like isoform X2 [Diospyros lotus]XP_052196096.1 double-stranded RNA-binding protein 4-like isoform X2 [Diospyros lotus]
MEGDQHPPRFRSTVLIKGDYYNSAGTFANRTAAEKDAARAALVGVSQKSRHEMTLFTFEVPIFCKAILNEYAMKMKIQKPAYNTIKQGGLVPAFVSSLVFNGVTYTGLEGKNKKNAERLAARAVILSLLGNSDSRTVLSEIIKSNRFYAASHIVNEPNSTHDVIMTVAANTGSLGLTQSKKNEVEAGGSTLKVPSTGVPETGPGKLNNVPATDQPFHESKKPRLEQPSDADTPFLDLTLAIGSSSTRTQNVENKKKGKEQLQDEQWWLSL